jgi:hypothetical protein
LSGYFITLIYFHNHPVSLANVRGQYLDRGFVLLEIDFQHSAGRRQENVQDVSLRIEKQEPITIFGIGKDLLWADNVRHFATSVEKFR